MDRPLGLPSFQYGMADKPSDALGWTLCGLWCLCAACPEGIPVHLLNRKILDNIEENFGITAGLAPREGAVLNTFKPDDKENFIK